MAILLPDLIQQATQGESLSFLPFWSHHPPETGEIDLSCLSHWFQLPFLAEQMVYPTIQHWMMAQKAQLAGDRDRLALILNARMPSEAKQIGASVQFEDSREWEAKRFALAVQGNHAKFSQHPMLAELLQMTDPYVLAYAHPGDKVWGVGLKAGHEDLPHPDRWPGENLLGFALMEVRRLLAPQ